MYSGKKCTALGIAVGITLATLLLAGGASAGGEGPSTAISLSGSTSGSVAEGGHVFYKFYARSGQQVTVTLSPSSGDPDLYVYYPSRLYLDSNVSDDAESRKVVFIAPTSGYYYAEAYGYQAGSYIISVTTTFASPTLNITAYTIEIAAGEPRSIGFIVTSAGVPVPGVTVTLTGAATGSGTTDITGIVDISVNAASEGTITATASKAGFYSASTGVTVIGLASDILDSVITGTVTNAASGAPITGATVIAGDMTATTDTAGRYSISIATLTYSAYTVTASASGFTAGSRSVTVVGGTTVTQNFALRPAVVEGTITRSFSSASISPGGTLTVTLTPSPTTLFDLPGYQVVETIPSMFTVTPDPTVSVATNAGNIWTFIQIGSAPVKYAVTATSISGTYTFSGTFKDDNAVSGNVGGTKVIIGGSPSSGTVTRSISPSSVPPGVTLTVTLTPAPSTQFDIPGYQVIETLPDGFTNLSTTAASSVDGNIVTLTQIGSSPITYTLTAPSTTGSYSIDGVFRDDLTNAGAVAGTASIRVGTGYDTNGNGRIDRSEAVQAVIDYFSTIITRQEAMDIVIRFFSGGYLN